MAKPLKLKKIEIKEFAQRVEQLCNSLLSVRKVRDGSSYQKMLEDLREDAVDIQFDTAEIT